MRGTTAAPPSPWAPDHWGHRSWTPSWQILSNKGLSNGFCDDPHIPLGRISKVTGIFRGKIMSKIQNKRYFFPLCARDNSICALVSVGVLPAPLLESDLITGCMSILLDSTGGEGAAPQHWQGTRDKTRARPKSIDNGPFVLIFWHYKSGENVRKFSQTCDQIGSRTRFSRIQEDSASAVHKRRLQNPLCLIGKQNISNFEATQDFPGEIRDQRSTKRSLQSHPLFNWKAKW